MKPSHSRFAEALTNAKAPAEGITRGLGPMALVYGVVKSIQQGATPTITITPTGSSTSVAGVKFLSTYIPKVNDTCLILKSDADLVAIGVTPANHYVGRVYRAAALNLISGNTDIPFDATNFDPQGMFTTNHFVAPISGYWAFTGSVGIAGATAAGALNTVLGSGGASYISRGTRANVTTTGGQSFPQSAVADVLYVAAGTAIYLTTYQDTGVGQPCLTGSDTCFMSVHLLPPMGQ